MSLSDCCQKEAQARLRRNHDIATCDACGSLLLAYTEKEAFDLTVQEMESQGATFATDRVESLYVVAKAR
jgi:hypothetical protein